MLNLSGVLLTFENCAHDTGSNLQAICSNCSEILNEYSKKCEEGNASA